MYATLSYDVSAGPTPVEDVRRLILELFDDRASCDLLSDTFICEIKSTEDYLELADQLHAVGSDVDGQFQFVFTLHEARALLRTNTAFPDKAIDILKPGTDE
jgi:hypothetical protein